MEERKFIGEVRINENFTCEGTVILRCRISLRFPSGEEGIEAFYRSVAENSFAYVKTALFDMSRTSFDMSEDEKKRFRFVPFVYRLLGDVTLDTERFFSQRLDASFSHAGERLCFVSDGHVWQKKGNTLLSPRRSLIEYGIKPPKGDIDSALLCDTGALILRGGAWQSI